MCLQRAHSKPASPAPLLLCSRRADEKHQSAKARMQLNLKVQVKMAAASDKHTGCRPALAAHEACCHF